MKDKRRNERLPLEVEVEITVPGFFRRKKKVMRTRDLSHDGVFVACDTKNCLPVGSEIDIRLTGLIEGQEPPLVRARIVRVTADGMAIAFLSK